jgi:hypothetical protein
MIAYFGGAEIPTYRELLHERGVRHMAMNYVNHYRRVKTTDWLISDHYPEDAKIFVDSGARTFNRPLVEVPALEIETVANDYDRFISNNLDRIDGFLEFDAIALPMEKRRLALGMDPDKGIPVWHAEDGLHNLLELTQKWKRVAVSATAIGDRDLAPVYRELARKTQLHLIGADKGLLNAGIAWASLSQSTWLSASQRGETFVWSGHEMRRYDATRKDQGRKKHRVLFESLGLSVEKIEADDAIENLKLAIWSWGQNLAYLDGSDSVTRGPNLRLVGTAENSLASVEETHPEWVHDAVSGPHAQTAQDMAMRAREKVQELLSGDKLPSDALTKPQRAALFDAMISMQAERVFFMREAEESEGGYTNKDLSAELDRLRKLLESKDELENTGFSLVVKANQRGGDQPGILTRLFGGGQPQAAIAADTSASAEQILGKAEVLDAEVVSDVVTG